MAYVEAHAGLRDHLKTKKVARLLGIPKAQVIGHLLCLWWWCQEYAQDGNLTAFDHDDIAEAAEWEGNPEQFVNALMTCGVKGGAGFVELTEDQSLIIHDWYQYGGKLFVQREQAAARMRNYRTRNATVTQENGNVHDSYASVTRNDTVTVTHVTPIDKIRIDHTIPKDASDLFDAQENAAIAVPTALDPLPLTRQFDALVEELKVSSNKPAVLKKVYVLCYGESTAPDFAYLGRVAKQVGGAGRLAELLFKHVSRPPVGDILAYVLKEHKNAEKYQAMNGGNRAPTEIRFAQNGDDIYA